MRQWYMKRRLQFWKLVQRLGVFLVNQSNARLPIKAKPVKQPGQAKNRHYSRHATVDRSRRSREVQRERRSERYRRVARWRR